MSTGIPVAVTDEIIAYLQVGRQDFGFDIGVRPVGQTYEDRH